MISIFTIPLSYLFTMFPSQPNLKYRVPYLPLLTPRGIIPCSWRDTDNLGTNNRHSNNNIINNTDTDDNDTD